MKQKNGQLLRAEGARGDEEDAAAAPQAGAATRENGERSASRAAGPKRYRAVDRLRPPPIREIICEASYAAGTTRRENRRLGVNVSRGHARGNSFPGRRV